MVQSAAAAAAAAASSAAAGWPDGRAQGGAVKNTVPSPSLALELHKTRDATRLVL
jgi:hypothetical protein